MTEYQIEMIKRLKESNKISFKEIENIMSAFQIASGQGYAIDKTKGILDFLNHYGIILITNIPNRDNMVVRNTMELSNLYLSIDCFVNIMENKTFEKYFGI